MSQLLENGSGDGDDSRCGECRQAIATGPCAACEQMICPDCGILTNDPSGVRVVCVSCVRLVADVNARPVRRRPGHAMMLLAISIVVAFALATLALASCGGPSAEERTLAMLNPPEVSKAKLPETRQLVAAPVADEPAGLGSGHTVVARVFAFADVQLAYRYGKASFVMSPVSERLSFWRGVRPAAVSDGADLIAETILGEYRKFYPSHSLVFLGNAGAIGCRQEYERFERALARYGLRSLLSVAGTHEAFFAGAFTSREDLANGLTQTDMPHDWTRACSEPDSFDDYRLTKGNGIERIHGLLPQADAWATSASYLGMQAPNGYRGAYLYYVRRLRGGDKGAPPAWGIFLDTLDYRDDASTRIVGEGSVAEAQLQFLDRAIGEARLTGGKASAAFVLFGHHCMDQVDESSRHRVLRFLDNHPDVPGYVCAGTSRATTTVTLPSGRTVSQIAVGSVIESPHSAAVVEVQFAPKGEQRAVVAKRLMVASTQCNGVKEPAAEFAYLSYRTVSEDNGVALDRLIEGLALDTDTSGALVHTLGALLVENQLARTTAHMYLHSGIEIAKADAAVLRGIVDKPYAAGTELADLTPWLRGRAKHRVSAYNRWHGEDVQSVMAVAELGVHRFGPHKAAFERVRTARNRSSAGRQAVLCHAIHAATALSGVKSTDEESFRLR